MVAVDRWSATSALVAFPGALGRCENDKRSCGMITKRMMMAEIRKTALVIYSFLGERGTSVTGCSCYLLGMKVSLKLGRLTYEAVASGSVSS